MKDQNGIGSLKFHQKIHFKITVLLILTFIITGSLNYYIWQKNGGELETGTIDITKKTIGDVKKMVSDNLIVISENTIKILAELVYFKQLAFLKDRSELANVNDAQRLIDFCISSAEYQRLFNFNCPLTKNSYITVSIYNGPKLVLISHNKKSIIGLDIFELVKKLSPEDRKKQQTEKFISHWVNRESGGIYYEQTATFKDASIPSEYSKKYAYQYWGKFNGIDIVVEWTAYIDEFMKPIKAIENMHAASIDKIAMHTSSSINQNFKLQFYTLIFIMTLSLIVLFLVIKSFVIKPVNYIIAGLKRFGEGDFSQPISLKIGGEYQIISAASDSMAEKLADTMHKLEKINADLENTVIRRTAELAESKSLLEIEKVKSENIIKNMLPEKIAKKLMDNPDQTIAEEYAMATVIFSDFKGFTGMSESSTPQKLIRELNEVFAHFDGLCEQYNIEKIKTIGDAYMAVAGIPEPNETHPFDAIEMAFKMRNFIAKRLEDKSNMALEIRIGIHSGPLIAGVLGRKKMVYDIWGDSVNIASRMESNGAAGKINISHGTYKLLKEKYNCEYRGETEIKGKGAMKMYFVEK